MCDAGARTTNLTSASGFVSVLAPDTDTVGHTCTYLLTPPRTNFINITLNMFVGAGTWVRYHRASSLGFDCSSGVSPCG